MDQLAGLAAIRRLQHPPVTKLSSRLPSSTIRSRGVGPDVSETDAMLVRGALRGNTQAIEALVVRFQSDVFGLCVKLLRHRQDAEDVTQEVFLRIFRSLQRWDSSRPLKPWIMGITVNRCRTWLAQRVRRPELADYLHDTAAGKADDEPVEMVQEIQAAVAELRLEYQTAFVLYHDQGLPYEEIAQALKKPVGTVKTWLHRARMEVMARLQRRGMVEVQHEVP